jgi:RNA recognition motif-containing protein
MSSDDDSDEYEDDEIKQKKTKKEKKEKTENSESENSENEKEKKNKKNSLSENSDSNSENSENEKNSKNLKNKNNEKEKKDIKNKNKSNSNSKNSSPKKVKNPNKENKSYSSGTWPEIFIKNLSYSTTEDSLKNFFSQFGEVEMTKIVYDKEKKRSKGVGFCKFKLPSSATKVLNSGQLELDGRPIAIKYSNEKFEVKNNNDNQFKKDNNFSGEKFSIFVGNLSFKSNEDGLKNFFDDCGKIIDIRISKNENGKSRGFAHVDFENEESLENAINKSGYKLDGRELRIERSVSKSNNSNSYNYKNSNNNKSWNKNNNSNNNSNYKGNVNVGENKGSRKVFKDSDDDDDDE